MAISSLKLLFAAISIMIGLSLVACGGDSNPVTSEPTMQTPTPWLESSGLWGR